MRLSMFAPANDCREPVDVCVCERLLLGGPTKRPWRRRLREAVGRAPREGVSLLGAKDEDGTIVRDQRS